MVQAHQSGPSFTLSPVYNVKYLCHVKRVNRRRHASIREDRHMASRYAIYISSKAIGPCYTFTASYPTLDGAQKEAERINRDLSNVKAIVIECTGPTHLVDPYYNSFSGVDTDAA